jgi:two-component system sensor histidine kinase TctE
MSVAAPRDDADRAHGEPRPARVGATLRSRLLAWLLVPLTLLLLVDALGSYVIARRLADRVYDGELLEIARELALHVKPANGKPAYDLEKDGEPTLLLQQSDEVNYSVRAPDGSRIAGDADVVAEADQLLVPVLLAHDTSLARY